MLNFTGNVFFHYYFLCHFSCWWVKEEAVLCWVQDPPDQGSTSAGWPSAVRAQWWHKIDLESTFGSWKHWRKTVYNTENCMLRLVQASLWWEEVSWHWAAPNNLLLVLPAHNAIRLLLHPPMGTPGKNNRDPRGAENTPCFSSSPFSLQHNHQDHTVCSDGPAQLGSHRLRTATSGWPPAPPITQGPADTKSCMTASPCNSQPPEYLHHGLVGKWPFFCPNSFHISVVFIQDTVSQRGCWDATSLVLQTARCGNITWWSKE